MTTASDTAALETRALRMIRAGDDHKTITAATGLTQTEQDKLRRDFPGGPRTAPVPIARPAKVCDYAGCHTVAVATANGWGFCEQHQKREAEDAAPATPPPSSIGRLLEDATAHSISRVRALAARIETDLDKLRALITEHAEAEQAKQRARAAREAAHARVKQLEAELRDAKAALKSGPTTVTADAGDIATSPTPCTSCGGPITRPKGAGGRWHTKCAGCR